MARAIEKGATYLDKLCHRFYDEPKGRGKKTDYVCRLCGGPLETYYCEERLYLVKCADCGTLALVKTVNPEVSASVTLARPTLTQPSEGEKDKNVPPNGPLTLEELRLMVEPTPVWWDWVQGWVLARKGMIISWNGVYYNFGEVKGNFYRRPPEGEEETP